MDRALNRRSALASISLLSISTPALHSSTLPLHSSLPHFLPMPPPPPFPFSQIPFELTWICHLKAEMTSTGTGHIHSFKVKKNKTLTCLTKRKYYPSMFPVIVQQRNMMTNWSRSSPANQFIFNGIMYYSMLMVAMINEEHVRMGPYLSGGSLLHSRQRNQDNELVCNLATRSILGETPWKRGFGCFQLQKMTRVELWHKNV